MNDIKDLSWKIQHFTELDVKTFHDIIELRIEVFVVEQNCIYQDLDGNDTNSFHLFAKNPEGQVVAYLRLIPRGVYSMEATIGRVIVKKNYRGLKLGHEIMMRALAFIKEHMGTIPLKLSAQKHLEPYYNKHGFTKSGPGYLEDGIPHIPMSK